MKKFYRYSVIICLLALMLIPVFRSSAGNEDRAGQAGASELLVNPWARSSGWGNVSTASVRGLESLFSNVAGIAFTNRTELVFANTDYLKGSDIDLIAFGLTQRVSETGVLGLAVMSMNFGDIPETTVDQPEGTGATFAPSYLNINAAYSKAFSNSIYGGFNFKIISESISNASAQGIAIDAGIQYITGENENVKFGVSLRNIGPRMRFSGDGFSIRAMLSGQESLFRLEHRIQDFELPAQLNIGGAYDFLFERETRLTVAANFASNAFTKDQYVGGLEFSFRDYVMLRGAYTFEEGITEGIENQDRATAHKGLSAGITVQVPLDEEFGSVFGVDYSYRATDHFDGIHTIGAKFSF